MLCFQLPNNLLIINKSHPKIIPGTQILGITPQHLILFLILLPIIYEAHHAGGESQGVMVVLHPWDHGFGLFEEGSFVVALPEEVGGIEEALDVEVGLEFNQGVKDAVKLVKE